MADTSAQLTVEDWVRREWMRAQYGQPCSRERVRLTPGGVFDFDAVSADHRIVAVISTSGYKTATGRSGSGKMHKIRSDIYFLLLTEVERKLVLLTEQDMYAQWEKEVEKGRVPDSVEFVRVEIPEDLNRQLRDSRRAASREVTPEG
ncbi:MAG: hypothetical protein F4X11_19520 [Acidobacteria bacterium]|nr:hypothetical protein [Acidobacteriota bacterium]